MLRTIRHDNIDYVNPAIFSFTDAARREIYRLRSAFPDKFIVIGWGYGVSVHTQEGRVLEELGDRIMVALGGQDDEPLEPSLAASVGGQDLELAIPADVTASETPIIDTDARGRLMLRR